MNGLLIAVEVWGRHATEDARRAAHLIQATPLQQRRLAVGHLLPLALLSSSPSFVAAAGAWP